MSYRPPRPRIVKPRLKWRWRDKLGIWQPQHRVTWTEGGKRKERAITLDWQGDPKKLDDLYWACEAGQHEAQQPVAKYTWGECIEEWRKDPHVQDHLADSTKKSYRREMDSLRKKNSKKDMRRTTRQAVRKKHADLAATPRKADWLLQTVSLLWNYAKKDLDWPLGDNPASGIKHFGKQREYEPWPPWMIEAAKDAPENVWITVQLILGTGQRPTAAIEMRRDQFQGEWVTVTDEKGDKAFTIFCPQRLKQVVDSLPKRGAHILAKNLTEPLGYDAIEKAFRAWRKTLGERAKLYSLHGLRKSAINELSEAGATDAEIQAVTGQSAAMVAYYRAKANRKALSRNAQERRT
ncbi:tyrosine-type recombinase/integrase [Mameliella sp. MMSF_3455]|uniref:tyrosine-type recombinase/integrase n=1 Tax=Mameliella sp. MMSF_3455 TaxID=3046714 RepID=UPI00273F98F2|nr:tyrosine-type recombinase/integrase [Mameliella sp. MMSF_3455]